MVESKGRSTVPKEVTNQYSLRGKVFHRIREDILAGKYHENEELKEAAIGTECGVSRTPVREALRQLELEGLVNLERFRKKSLQKKERALQSNREHLAILEAMRHKDGDLAEKLAHEHIMHAIETMNQEGL